MIAALPCSLLKIHKRIMLQEGDTCIHLPLVLALCDLYTFEQMSTMQHYKLVHACLFSRGVSYGDT